tara:strand:- start:496 stop:624 length:129 start_codon:yes stop_codon:yes gene_type:complete
MGEIIAFLVGVIVGAIFSNVLKRLLKIGVSKAEEGVDDIEKG